MNELVKTDKYDTINTTYTTTMVHYVIKFMSKPYTLQEKHRVMEKSVLLMT